MAEADDLHIAPLREDEKTFGTPTWIWSVVVGNDLYVRAYNGTRSRWYQAAKKQNAGRISIAGATHDVTFEMTDGGVASDIDAAYRAKYRGSPYLGSMVSPRARAATVRVSPQP
jgi:hypothetical protein